MKLLVRKSGLIGAIGSILNKNQENNLFLTTKFIITHFQVKATDAHLADRILNHVEYPSLLTIKDVLFDYGIASGAIQKGNHFYHDFETPFVCAIQQEDWAQANFTVVTAASEQEIEYLNPLDHTLVKISSLDFEKIDREIILLLDGTAKKDEVFYAENKKKERVAKSIKRIPACLMICALFFTAFKLYSSPSSLNWISIVFLCTSFTGLAISSLLLWHEIDAHNPFIKQVCGGFGKKANCDAVLGSSGAMFMGISWSVWGLSYFAAFFLSQILFANQITYHHLWAILSLLASPYIIYSIYYQSKIVKQWCPLCLAVQCILFLNALLSFFLLYAVDFSVAIEGYTIYATVVLGICMLLLGYYAIPLIKQARDGRNYQKRWKKLRFHPDVFRLILSKGKYLSPVPESLGIVMGNPNAKHEIIKVCNPYCGPCSKAHPILEDIVRNNQDVKVRIIFKSSGRADDPTAIPAQHLLAVQEKYGAKAAERAVDDWYGAAIKDYDTFSTKYPINGELMAQQHKTVSMNEWCFKFKIRATPTLIIDGYEFPDDYRIDELKNLF